MSKNKNSLNCRHPALKNSFMMCAVTGIPNNRIIDDQIFKELIKLRDYGFKIFSFNNKDTLSFGLKYFVNHIIVSNRYLIFIEVSPEKEILEKDKKELQLFLSHLSSLNKSLHYWIIRNIKDCRRLTKLLITKNL